MRFLLERAPEANLNEFYEFIRNEGMVKKRLSPNTKGVERVFILSERAWESFENGLYSRFGSGASVILDGMAHEYGASIARMLLESRRSIDKIDLLEVLEGYAERASSVGWGVVVVSPPLQSPTAGNFVVRLKIKNCVFCSRGTEGEIGGSSVASSNTSNQKRTCFVAGILGGITGELLRAPHKVSEEKCIPLKDGNSCEISIKEERAGSPFRSSLAK